MRGWSYDGDFSVDNSRMSILTYIVGDSLIINNYTYFTLASI